MCLGLITWPGNDQLPLTVAFNRDEFFDRKTKSAQNWSDYTGGQDALSQGTWLAVRGSRFAMVTNLRNSFNPGALSRGQLTRQFVGGSTTVSEFINSIAYDKYSYFNLMIYDGQQLAVTTNPSRHTQLLAPGTYVLTNDEFQNCNHNLVSEFQSINHSVNDIFSLLDQHHVRDRVNYGTRSSTVIFNNQLYEKTYDVKGNLLHHVLINF